MQNFITTLCFSVVGGRAILRITVCMKSLLGNPSTTHKELEEDEGEEEEDPYALFRMTDEYDSILTSTTAISIANRPPAPTPRPESTHVKEDQTLFIAQGEYGEIKTTMNHITF